jgi:hypothetical protein
VDVCLSFGELERFIGLALQCSLSIELLGTLLRERYCFLCIVSGMQMQVRWIVW